MLIYSQRLLGKEGIWECGEQLHASVIVFIIIPLGCCCVFALAVVSILCIKGRANRRRCIEAGQPYGSWYNHVWSSNTYPTQSTNIATARIQPSPTNGFTHSRANGFNNSAYASMYNSNRQDVSTADFTAFYGQQNGPNQPPPSYEQATQKTSAVIYNSNGQVQLPIPSTNPNENKT